MDADVEQNHVAEVAELLETIKELGRKPLDALDKGALRRSLHSLTDYSKKEEMLDSIVGLGAVEVVVPLLSIGDTGEQQESSVSYEDIKKEACFILGLLAIRPEFQTRIAGANALPGLVRLLSAHRTTAVTRQQPGSGGVARRASDAITNLAHENSEIKNLVRNEGGIPPLVALLEAWDIKVQRAAAGALRTLAFKNEENKNQIVECGALPMLIQMLHSEDTGVHYEAVGVIGNLVHSSQHIKRRVLDEGALQPVINLLSSSCPESQREAALLLGQFATTQPNDDGPDYKSRIVQRGAVPPLIDMLSAADVAIKEMAAFALGRLAQNSHNQAGIVQSKGLVALLELLESKHYNLQHNAAFALYGLSDNEDNVPCIIKHGGLQKLVNCEERLQVQASKDCVHKTISRIEQKINIPRVLGHVAYMLRSKDRSVAQATAMALARLAPNKELKHIFVDKQALDIMLEVLTDVMAEPQMQREAARCLLKLVEKVNASTPCQAPVEKSRAVYLGEQYINNKQTLTDITFMVEGRPFHAHRIALLASSEAFRAMFNQGFREKDATCISIPNLSWAVFEVMMAYVYTGSAKVPEELAQEVLQAADMYLLEGLKRLCENTIAQGLSVDNLGEVLSLSEAYSAPQLAKACCLFALKEVDELTKVTEDNPYSFCQLMERVMPVLKSSLVEDLSKEIPDDMEIEVPEDGPAPVVAGAQAGAAQAAAAQAAALGDAGAGPKNTVSGV